MSLSLKNKLVYIIMGASTTVLMLTITIYLMFDVASLKKNKVKDIEVLAKIIAENNQAALLFNDKEAAKESLYSLIANKDIEYVCIVDKYGEIFSESNFTSIKIIPPKKKEDTGEKKNAIEVFHEIDFQGEKLGSLYIISNLNQVNNQIKIAIITGVSILIISLIISYILTYIIQRIITNPILELASISSEISENKDFSTKINIERNDEIGTLVNSFNNMLGEIDKQNIELTSAKIKAEQSSIAKEQFLANMSHEIRTPLNGIDGMAKLLEKTSLTKEQQEYNLAIRTSSDNLLVIINDILDFSKIEAGKLTIEKIGFNLKESINRIINTMVYKTEEKRINLESEIDQNISEVLIGDPTRINQIIINLLNNAIKFTSKGCVTLKCKLVGKSPTNNKIKFEVIDTGIGIEQENLSKIFESFSQEDESTTRKFGGTGLGLTISKQLVELFNGELKVKSEKGKGTTFYFTVEFPIGSSKDWLKDEVTVADWESLEHKKVLLVEDNKINQFLATTILKNWKMKVEVAENGLIAIKKLKDQDFDVVLMDMQMPIMGGIEATAIIREELKLSIPIIALTARAIKGVDKECFEAGMNDYISKPFNQSELFNKILNLVNYGTKTL
jgi:signal transduction histidine kinase/CheY-like chemotaxis protein